VSDDNVSPALALTATTLYWVDRGGNISDTINAVSLSGGNSKTIYTATPDGTAAIEDLVTDGTSLYFLQVSGYGDGTYTTDIKSIPIDGGTSTLLASDSTSDLVIAVADGYVYFTDEAGDGQRVPTKGGTPEAFATSSQAMGLASQGGALYFASGTSDMLKLASPSAKPQTLATDTTTNTESDSLFNVAVAVNDSGVFWPCEDDSSAILCGTSTKGGGPITVLGALSSTTNVQLAADNANVYFLDAESACPALTKVPVGGGDPVVIASDFTPVTALSMAHAIAIDDTYVYWTAPGQVLRAPK
jgi:Domain of unknown function (DUF5050)